MRKILILILILLGLLIVGLFYYLYQSSQVSVVLSDADIEISSEALDEQIRAIEEKQEPVGPESDARQAYSFVILGLDSRQDDLKGRSDAILYVDLDHYNKEIKVISFMRDLRVAIEGHGQSKLGHAYAYGRERLAVKTLEGNFDLDIDAFIALNFKILKDVVDVLGGLELEINQEEVSQIDGISKPGVYLLEGHQVLSYARIRKVGNGDFERTLRQRLVLEVVINKLSELSNDDLLEAIGEIYPLIYTNLDLDEIYEEVLKYRDDGQAYTMSSILVPSKNSFEEARIDGLYYLVLNDIQESIMEIKTFLEESE